MQKILVLAAHPDDEVLGCSGTLTKYVSQGAAVLPIFLSTGVGSRSISTVSDSAEVEARKAAAEKVAVLLGFERPIFLDYPDNQLDTVPLLDVVKEVETLCKKFQADALFTHSFCDLNVDHVLTARVALTVSRPTPEQTITSVYGFEVPSSTGWGASNFNPQMYVDISDFFRKKHEALLCYDYEMRLPPHARSYEALEALAKFRGSTVGVACAEAFEVYRMIR